MDVLTILLFLHLQYNLGFPKSCLVNHTSKRVENAALNKHASQISTYDIGIASKAVDGDSNPVYSDGSCIHTWWQDGLPLFQWWMVDLEWDYRIDSVNITNRLKHNHRLHDFDIFVSLNSTFEDDDHMTDDSLCTHVSGEMGSGETRTFTCQTPVFGQFVQIYMETPDKRHLHICEVTVEGYRAVCIDEQANSTAKTTSVATPAKTSVATQETTSVTTRETTSVATTKTTSVATPETTSVATPETTSVATPETTSVATPETTSVATPETTSVATPETTSVATATTASVATTETTSVATATTPSAISTTTSETTINATELWKSTPTMSTSSTSTATKRNQTVSATSLPSNKTTTATPACQCSCGVLLKHSNLTQEALLELIKELRKELEVNKKETSIYKRKLISVGDERQSAEAIGFVGVLALCVPILLIVSFDLINLWSFAKQKRNRVIPK